VLRRSLESACTWFHRETHSAPGSSAVPRSANDSRDFRRRLVETGHAHAALVFDGETAVGRAQYGSPDELPGISHRKEVDAAGSSLPHWRVTCIFVDSYPQDTAGEKVSASFLYNATRSTFEQAGFTYDRPKGKITA
jgi:hypothetical protein